MSLYVLVRFSSLGDVVLTTGLIEYLGQTQNHQAIVITKQAFAPIFKANPFVKQVYCLENQSLLKLVKKIIQEHGPIPLYDLHANLRAFILKLLWPEKTFTYAKLVLARRLFLWSKGKIKLPGLNLNVPQRYARSFFKIPPSVEELKPRLYLLQQEKIWASQKLTSLNLAPQKFILIHPYASFSSKNWPKTFWQNYLKLLSKAQIPYLIIGKAKTPLDDQPFDLTNQTNLRQTIALIDQAGLVVSTDSGPLHLAWGLNKPLLGIFGPSVKEWGFFPQGKNVTILQAPIKCRPCSLHGQKNCHHLTCLTQITPEQVLTHTRL